MRHLEWIVFVEAVFDGLKHLTKTEGDLAMRFLCKILLTAKAAVGLARLHAHQFEVAPAWAP